MTTDDAGPQIPDAVRREWGELLDLTRRRQEALAEADRLSGQCRALVVVLLRAGVRRRDLLGRPFSDRWLTRIQREEGLTRAASRGAGWVSTP